MSRKRKTRKFRPLVELLEDRITPSGDFGFAHALGGSRFDTGRGAAADDAGNVYITGSFTAGFENVVDFDPGPGEALFEDDDGAFVAKYNRSGGLEWARRLGNSSADGYGIAVDSGGNVYSTGVFSGTGDFDPDPVEEHLLTSNGGSYVTKLDKDGNFVWATTTGRSESAGSVSTRALALDGQGDVYITGGLSGTMVLNPGPEAQTLTSTGETDVFVSKLTTDGDFVWAAHLGGAENDLGFDITVDSQGNVYTTGSYEGPADFDPGRGTENLTDHGGFSDAFISKLNNDGSFGWAVGVGGTGQDIGLGIAVDTDDNVYTTGWFEDTVDFNPGEEEFPLSSANTDIFVLKLTKDANFVWAGSMPGSEIAAGWAIDLDGAGGVYVTGDFEGIVDFDPDPDPESVHNLQSAGRQDIFVSKLTEDGDFVWAQRMGGTEADEGRSIAVTSAGEVYTTGEFQGTADFDPGEGVENRSSNDGSSDIFLSQLTQVIPPVANDDEAVTRADQNVTINVFSNDEITTDGTLLDFKKISDDEGTPENFTLGDLDMFGTAATSIGDLDGDGITDLAVTAIGDRDGDEGRGAVYILFMNADGSVRDFNKIVHRVDTATDFSLGEFDVLGNSLTALGDVNGDNITDLAVWVATAGGEDQARGVLYVLFLDEDGTVKSSTRISDADGTPDDFSLDPADLFGNSLAAVGDLDGDGISELAVGASGDDDGATDSGAVYVLFLNDEGKVRHFKKISDTTGTPADFSLSGDDGFGLSMAAIGDLNNDTIPDIAVGARNPSGGSEVDFPGAVYVLFLQEDGTVGSFQEISEGVGAPPELTLDKFDGFGRSITALGDVDGDGVTDLAVGSLDTIGETLEEFQDFKFPGAVYTLFMNTDGTVKDLQKIPVDQVSSEDNSAFGTSMANLGDLNGDGLPDLIVGANTEQESDEFQFLGKGALYVLALNPLQSITAIDGEEVTEDNPITLESGALVTVRPGGRIEYDPNGRFYHLTDGKSATDEFTYSLSNIAGVTDTATVTVTLNSRARAKDDEAATEENIPFAIDVQANDLIGVAVKESRRIADGVSNLSLSSRDRFGFSVAGLGDLNNDGIYELAVGARGDDDGGLDHNDNRGAVYVLSLDSEGSLVSVEKISDSNGALSLIRGDSFGSSLAALGDVDDNGFVDLAVGASGSGGLSNTGAVYVISRSANGGFEIVQKISNDTNGLSLGNSGLFGGSVTALGDVDGNGSVDLAVGAPGDDDGGLIGVDVGAVYALLRTDSDQLESIRRISDSTLTLSNDDQFGSSMTLLGDLNGDGLPEIAVGTPGDRDGDIGVFSSERGAVYVLSVVDDNGSLEVFGKISNDGGRLSLGRHYRFGTSVTAVGDLNGDGLTDLAVGATGADELDGALYVLFLNESGAVKDFQQISGDGVRLSLNDRVGFGRSVTPLGDLNGDGVLDLAVGTSFDEESRGSVYVLFMTPSHTINAINGNPVIPDQPIPLESGALARLQSDGKIHYDPNGRFDYLRTGETATDTFTYTLIDKDGRTETATVTVTLNGRSAPVLHADGVLTPITDDDVNNFGNSVREILGDTVTGVYNDLEPGLALINTEDGNGQWQVSFNTGQSWENISLSGGDVRFLLKPDDRLRFVPDGDQGDVAFIDYRAWDNSGPRVINPSSTTLRDTISSSVASARIDVLDVNDAPVLDTSSDLQLDPVAAGDALNPGTSVADLIAGAIMDADGDTDLGIAITFVDNSDGAWQYTIDGGTIWNDFGSPTSGAARLLTDDPGSRIRYVSAADSIEPSSLRFRAWDQSGGRENGSTANTFANGFDSAFSDLVGTAVVTIDPEAAPHDPVLRFADQVLDPTEDKLVLDLAAHGGAWSVQIAGSMAWFLDRDLNPEIHADGDFFDALGGQERWVMGETNQFGSPWYYLLPGGEFYAWDPAPATALRGALVETIEPLYHHSLHLLTEAAGNSGSQEHLAFILDEGLELRRDPGPGDDDWFNAFGMQERWVAGAVNQFGNPSYFIKPNGEFFAWDGTPMQATGMRLATLDPINYEELSRLYDAQPDQVSAAIGTGNDQLIIDPVDGFAGHMWVELTQTNSVTSASDIFKFTVGIANAAPEIAPVADLTMSTTETVRVVPVTVTDSDGDAVSLSASAIGFFVDLNTFQDWGGRNEKWVRGTDGDWYFILPTGEFFRWDKNPIAATGEKLATFDAIFWNELDRLTGAKEQRFSAIAFEDEVFIDPENGFTGSFWILLEASDRRDTAYSMFRVTVNE